MRGARCILYVEDDPDHAELVLRCLERSNARQGAVHVADGELALAYLRACVRGECPRPELVLLDLRLPKVDGVEVLREVKGSEELRDIPVVVLTTSTRPADVGQAYALHANSYLVKPDGLERLVAMIDALAAYWLRWNRPPPSAG